jgi:hypothetical protein
MAIAMYAYIRTCAKAKLESQRTADSGQKNYASPYYCKMHVRPKRHTRHQGHRRTRGGIKRDTKAKGTGGHTGDPRDTGRTRGHSGGIERGHQEDRREQRTTNNGGSERAVKSKRI